MGRLKCSELNGGSRPGPEGQGPLWTRQQPGPEDLRAAPQGRRRHAPQETIAESEKFCVRRACSCCYCTEMPVLAAPHAQIMPSGHCLAQHISQRGPEGHWGSAKAPPAIFFNAGPEGPQAPGPKDLRAWTWG